MKLRLVKIEEGLCTGEVLYHAFKSKTRAEAAATAARLLEQRQLKEARRREQEQNVLRKQQERAARQGQRGGGREDVADVSEPTPATATPARVRFKPRKRRKLQESAAE